MKNKISTRKINGCKTLTAGAVFCGTLWAILVGVTIYFTLQRCLKELEIEEDFSLLFYIVASVLGTMRGLRDALALDPAEEGERLALSTAEDELDRKLTQANCCERMLANSFNKFNQAAGLIYGAVISSSDLVTVRLITHNLPAGWIIGLPLTALDAFYYRMLLSFKIKWHSYKFIHYLFNCKKSIFLACIRSPLRFLENNNLFPKNRNGAVLKELGF